MKEKLIFAIIALGGALALYLTNKWELALGWVGVVWGVYAEYTRTVEVKELKKENKALKSNFEL